MKKTILFIVIVCTASIIQAQYLEKGERLLNLTVGSGLQTSLEFAPSDKISFGPFLAIYRDNLSSTKIRFTGFGGVANYHFFQTDEWDVFGGARVGYELGNASSEDISVDYNGAIFGFHVGARYVINPQWAGLINVGGGLLIAQIGITYKVKTKSNKE